MVDKIKGVDVLDTVVVDKVLLTGTQAETVVGRPYIKDVKVVMEVEEQTRDAKITIFKKKKRKGYQKKRGYRREITVLRIKDIIEE